MNKIKFFGITGLSSCLLCCLIPIIGITIGSGTVLAIGAYLENLALVFLAISTLLIGIFYYRKRKIATACQVGCTCKPTTEK